MGSAVSHTLSWAGAVLPKWIKSLLVSVSLSYLGDEVGAVVVLLLACTVVLLPYPLLCVAWIFPVLPSSELKIPITG